MNGVMGEEGVISGHKQASGTSTCSASGSGLCAALAISTKECSKQMTSLPWRLTVPLPRNVSRKKNNEARETLSNLCLSWEFLDIFSKSDIKDLSV